LNRILAAASLFTALFAATLSAQSALTTGPVSTWQGSIQTGSEHHRAVLQMWKTDKDEWQPKNLYIEFVPDYHTLVESPTSSASHLRFSINNGKGAFDAVISPDSSTITGTVNYNNALSKIELHQTETSQAWHVPFLYQYHYKDATYYRPAANEPTIPFSAKLALTYLDQGALAWTNESHCVACHTNGTYMVVRPMMTSQLGPPQKDLHDFFLKALREQLTPDPDDPKWEPAVSQTVYIAAGLAIWDANVTHKLSPETAQALDLMFKLQRPTGDWYIDDPNNPPLESNDFQLATVAARAAANAPGWLATQRGTPNEARLQLLEKRLRAEQNTQGDYDRTDLLWTAAEYPGLLDARRMQELTQMVLAHQQADGGWSIRTFAKAEQWASGQRAEKLRTEPDFKNPPSDGHMTGLAIIALRKAGIPASDPRIQRGVAWLLANQRASGRWYTRSLNRDGWQFITYSGTAYPLLALSMCNALPAAPETAAHIATSAGGK
jgi:squalene-hopene/tetraprenyl-beta-curcumene cyclase